MVNYVEYRYKEKYKSYIIKVVIIIYFKIKVYVLFFKKIFNGVCFVYLVFMDL